MNPSFGALVSYRRRVLGLTKVQLAQRMVASGQPMDIAGLELGVADLSQHETRTSLAIALEWPVELVEAMHEASSGAVMELTAPDHRAADAVQVIREELVLLRILRMTLQQWMDDLEGRVYAVLVDTDLRRKSVRLDD